MSTRFPNIMANGRWGDDSLGNGVLYLGLAFWPSSLAWILIPVDLRPQFSDFLDTTLETKDEGGFKTTSDLYENKKDTGTLIGIFQTAPIIGCYVSMQSVSSSENRRCAAEKILLSSLKLVLPRVLRGRVAGSKLG